MRIGEPAHRHGVSEPDAVHAMRRIVMDDDLTMLIGPADGRLLESASCTWTARTPSSYMRCSCDRSSGGFSAEGMNAMARHTDEEIERAAERFERLAEDLDPDQVKAHSTDEVSSGQAPIIHTMSGAG